MNLVLVSLWPIFALILAGYYLNRIGFPGEGFWPGAERFNYFILFPALLFGSLSSAPLNDPALPRLLVAVLLVVFLCCTGLLVCRQLRKWPSSRFGVLLQGILRFNTYLGLAAVGGLYGKEGMQLATVVIALLVPIVNVLSVWALSADKHTSLGSMVSPIARNPLIVSCLAGAMFNLSGGQLVWGTDRLFTLLANTSLPLGLLSVGAALRPTDVRGQLGTLIGNSLARLLVVPSIAWLCARVMGLPTIETAILVLFFALPTAPTSYVLTRQLGGEGQLMAAIITIQTLLSAVSLLLVIAVVG